MARTYFFWDPDEDTIVQERDSLGAITTEYTTEPDLYGNLISQNRQGVDSQYHFDPQGSTLALSDDNQNVTDTYAYTAFGELATTSGATANSIRYVGAKQYYFEDNGPDYYVRLRLVSPHQGSWLSRDPFLLATDTNRYLYVGNGPTSRVDPSGLFFPFTPPIPPPAPAPAPPPPWIASSPIPPLPVGCLAAPAPIVPIAIAPPAAPFAPPPPAACAVYAAQCTAGWAYGCNAFWACAVGSAPRPITFNNPIVGVYANPAGSANCARGCLQSASAINGMGPPVPAIPPVGLTCYCIYWFHLDCFRRCSFWPPWPFNWPLFAAQCTCPCGVAGRNAANRILGLPPPYGVIVPPPGPCIPIPPGVPPPGTGGFFVP